MPEATVYKNNSIVFPEDQIGFARHVFLMQTIAETFPEESLPYQEFRLCVFTPDPRHIERPLGFSEYISHGIPNA